MLVKIGSTDHPSVWIKEYRKAKGWTQREFAKRCTIDEANFSKYMSGALRIKPTLAKRIEAVTGIDSEDILYQQYLYYRAKNKKI